MVSSHSFPGDKTQCQAAGATLTHENIHAGTKNSPPSPPSLRKQRAQRSAAPPPEPPNGNSRGPPASPRRLPGGGHWAQGSWSLPPRTGAASPTRVHVPPQPGPDRRGAVGHRCGAAPAASQAQRRPHTPPPPAPEAAARDAAGVRGAPGSRQSYSLGKRGCPGRAPAPGAAAQRPLRSPGPADGAGSEAASARPGIAAATAAAAAAADFLARSKLWLRLHFSTAPAAFPGVNARAPPPNPTRTWTNWQQSRAGGGGTERGSAYPRTQGAGQARAVTP